MFIGRPGSQGSPGPDGVIGLKGEQGEPGAIGNPGIMGPDGFPVKYFVFHFKCIISQCHLNIVAFTRGILVM